MFPDTRPGVLGGQVKEPQDSQTGLRWGPSQGPVWSPRVPKGPLGIARGRKGNQLSRSPPATPKRGFSVKLVFERKLKLFILSLFSFALGHLGLTQTSPFPPWGPALTVPLPRFTWLCSREETGSSSCHPFYFLHSTHLNLKSSLHQFSPLPPPLDSELSKAMACRPCSVLYFQC